MTTIEQLDNLITQLINEKELDALFPVSIPFIMIFLL